MTGVMERNEASLRRYHQRLTRDSFPSDGLDTAFPSISLLLTVGGAAGATRGVVANRKMKPSCGLASTFWPPTSLGNGALLA